MTNMLTLLTLLTAAGGLVWRLEPRTGPLAEQNSVAGRTGRYEKEARRGA